MHHDGNYTVFRSDALYIHQLRDPISEDSCKLKIAKARLYHLLCMLYMLTGSNRNINDDEAAQAFNPAIVILQLIQFNFARQRNYSESLADIPRKRKHH